MILFAVNEIKQMQCTKVCIDLNTVTLQCINLICVYVSEVQEQRNWKSSRVSD